MEYTGLVQKFKVNRSLNDEEQALKLEQRRRLEIKPEHQLAVVRLNSSFLEMVDVYFDWKGAITFGALSGWLVIGGSVLMLGLGELMAPSPHAMIWNTFLMIFFGLALLIPTGWLAHFECFRHTHYPIRFNRKTRKVHVFRTNGTVLTADWDKLFFCLGRCYQPRNWTIQGHVLAEDRITVLETFSFPQPALGNRERELLKHVWEYVRRYMEEGPEPLVEQTPVVLPIADKREGFLFGWHRTHAIGGLFLLPVYLFFYPGRWIAMRTSKIPSWPAEVEQQCRISADDPCVRDITTNPQWAR